MDSTENAILQLVLSKFDDVARRQDDHGEILNEIVKDGKDRAERIAKLEATLNNGLKSTVNSIDKQVRELSERLIKLEDKLEATAKELSDHIDDETQAMLKQVFTVNPNDPMLHPDYPQIDPPADETKMKWAQFVMDNIVKIVIAVTVISCSIIYTILTGHIPDFVLSLLK